MSELDATTFGDWLRGHRKSLGLTQAELARKVGCATVTIQKIEADDRRPSRDMARWLAEACEIGAPQRQRFLRLARAGRTLTKREQIALDRRPTNLPLALPPLIGRERDLSIAHRRLLQEGARLLSLTGPPGVGKTSLALHLGVDLLSEFEDGAFFVSVASARDSQSVAAAIARALEVNEEGAGARRLKEYLTGKQLLLVLDNFEQALNSGPLVADLLRTCPWLSVIATSRAPLRIRQERRLLLEPLALPQETNGYSLDAIAKSPAVSLFVERARTATPDFGLTAENADAVARICARLGGLPLAIELVAARVSLLTPEALLERLGGALLLDSQGVDDVPDRHRTLRAAIDWSYNLISPSEQELFTRLAVCSGHFSLSAAEAMATGDMANGSVTDSERSRALDCLASLVDKGLVVRRDRAAEPRFLLLEPIREYALEVLKHAGAEKDSRQRHARYYLSLALEADPRLRGRGQTVWLDCLESERGNLQTALGFLIGPGNDAGRALQLANGLFWFWNIRGHLSEGRAWLTRALEASERVGAPPQQRAKAMSALAAFDWQEGDLHTARARIDESLRLFRSLGRAPSRDHALAHCVLAMVALFRGDEATALSAGEESFRMFSDLDDRSGMALAMNPIGKVRLQRHELLAARSEFERSHALFLELGDNWGAAIPLMNLGVLEAAAGRQAAARARLEESVRLFESVGERLMRALVLDGLASLLVADGEVTHATALRQQSLDILTKMGLAGSLATVLFNFARVLQSHQDHEQALALFEQSVGLLSEQHLPRETARCLIGLASAAAGCGDLRRAARVLGVAEGVVESSGITLTAEDTAERDRTMIAFRAALDEETALVEWRQGLSMATEPALILRS